MTQSYPPGPIIPEEGFVRELVDLLEPHSEVPAEGHALAGIAAVSAALGGKSYLSFGTSSEPTQTWTLLVAPTGARKSTAIKTARHLAKTGNAVRASMHETQWLRPMSPRHFSDKGLAEILKPPTDEAELAAHEAHGPPSHLWELDEVGALFTGNGRPDDWRGASRAAMLTLAGGETPDTWTAGNRIASTSVAITCIGAMTDAEFRDAAAHFAPLVSSGWVGRWLVLPMGEAPRSLAFPVADPGTEARFRKLAAWVADLCNGSRSDRIENAYTLADAGAQELYRDWYDAHHARGMEVARLNGQCDPLEHLKAQYMNRATVLAYKLATHQAVARSWQPGKRLADTIVKTADVLWAIGVVERSAAYIFDELMGNTSGPVADYQRRVVEYLIEKGATDEGKAIPERRLLENLRAPGPLRDDRAARRRAIGDLIGTDLAEAQEGKATHLYVLPEAQGAF